VLRRLRRSALALSVLFVCALVAMPKAGAQSSALVNVLTETQQLSNNDFTTLCTWARNGASAPFNNYFQPQKTQSDILALADKDRQAVLWWLQGNGRSALYARGASDYQIGPRRAPADKSATPAPAAWRQITLATATLNGDVQGPIQILGGFAAVKRDGTAAIACVSFKNVSKITARRVVVDFPLLDAQGSTVGTLTLDRNGEFSPGTVIASYADFSTWQQGGIGPRGYADNCIQKTLATAALPILQARTAGYNVRRVEFDDGSSWGSIVGVPQP
jgi:hypothetical protein